MAVKRRIRAIDPPTGEPRVPVADTAEALLRTHHETPTEDRVDSRLPGLRRLDLLNQIHSCLIGDEPPGRPPLGLDPPGARVRRDHVSCPDRRGHGRLGRLKPAPLAGGRLQTSFRDDGNQKLRNRRWGVLRRRSLVSWRA
jgi:hypothetical protein